MKRASQTRLQKMRLPASARADSCYCSSRCINFVWLAEQDELAVERMLILMWLLGGGGVPARAVGGAVRELQS